MIYRPKLPHDMKTERCDTRFRVLVTICSCRDRSLKRDCIRDTWLRTIPSGLKCVFFVGAGPLRVEPDVVTLDIDDGYYALPKKIHALFNEVLTKFNFDYLFKCDDDTYVALDRLPGLITEEVELIGDVYVRQYGWPCGGSGYLLSRNAVQTLAESEEPDYGPEDVWVGRTIAGANMQMGSSDKLQKECHLFPRGTNDIITSHYCSPDIMYVIHSILMGLTNSEHMQTFKAQHSNWTGVLELLSNGVFLGGFSGPHGRWSLLEDGELLLLEWYHWPKDLLQKTSTGYKSDGLTLTCSKNMS